MMDQVWSWILSLTSLSMMWLAGKKMRSAWIIGIVSQIVWFFYALAEHQYGFIVSAFFFAAVYIRNYILWGKERS